MKVVVLNALLGAVTICRAASQAFPSYGPSPAPVGPPLQAPAKNFPVSKVVMLLKDMQSQLQAEADSDQEVYEKLACWCETNDKAKTKAIADADTKLSDLQGAIETSAADSSRLKVEIERLEKEVAANQKALEEATALREKQLAEFNEEEKEMIQSIRALDAAIVVLSKHHTPAALASVMSTVTKQMQKHEDKLLGTITPSQKRTLLSFAQGGQAPTYFDAQPTYKNTYTPKSGEIFGILKQMKETFEKDLTDAQKEELQNQETFANLKVAKEEQISTGQGAVDSKKQELADADETLAQSKEDREDTKAAQDADKKFLTELKLKCQATDSEWEQRQKMRQEELSAVAEAIAILSGDDARDLFSRTFNRAAASFLQVQRSRRGQDRKSAADVLMAAAARTSNPKLAVLATAARLDPFTKVKKAIDDMVAQLLKEKADEISHRDMCIGELNTNEKTTAAKTHEKDSLELKIEGLDTKITTLADEIKVLEAEIVDMETQMKRAKENRDMEHKEFEGVVADQRETQALLVQALTVLKQVYQPATPVVPVTLAQVRRAARQAPPPDFSTYSKNQASHGIIAMMEQIMADAKLLEAETMHAETQAANAYTAFKQETTESITAKRGSITDKTSVKAKAEGEKVQAEQDHRGVVDELATLIQDEAALHASCDFTLKNFDARQEARDEEVEALRQAKAYLSGMQAPLE